MSYVSHTKVIVGVPPEARGGALYVTTGNILRSAISANNGNVISYRKQDLFATGAQVLVNPVNLVGVMGKGLAREFKRRFPAMFHAYVKACRTHTIKIAILQVYPCSAEERALVPGLETIINFPTKLHWQNPFIALFVDTGLEDLARILKELRPATVALPALGCGLGGLAWHEVRPLIERRLSGLDTAITICLPQ